MSNPYSMSRDAEYYDAELQQRCDTCGELSQYRFCSNLCFDAFLEELKVDDAIEEGM